jgi:hypothetical protein
MRFISSSCGPRRKDVFVLRFDPIGLAIHVCRAIVSTPSCVLCSYCTLQPQLFGSRDCTGVTPDGLILEHLMFAVGVSLGVCGSLHARRTSTLKRLR